MSENLLNMYLKGCAYLGHCDDSQVRYFMYQSVPWKFDDWSAAKPWVKEYLDCFTDFPVRHPNHTSFVDQVMSHMTCSCAQQSWYSR